MSHAVYAKYYLVFKGPEEREELSAEFLVEQEAHNWSMDLKRRGWPATVYEVDRQESQ